MATDPSKFYLFNVTDTCAVWHVLSSTTLYRAALSAKCVFSCTEYVAYECLIKVRKKTEASDEELQGRLRREQGLGNFRVYKLEVEDLLEVEILRKRKNLGKGELSSIAFANRTNQAFLTDDRGALKLAQQVMANGLVQSIPHLFGWLYFTDGLADKDKEIIISEHEALDGPLRKNFEEIYLLALQYRLLKKD